MSKRNSRLRGIVVVAETKAQVMDHFRAVASGNYQVFESKDGEFAIATSDTADLQIMNPLNGEEMIAVPDDEKHDIPAVASSGDDVDVFYTACASGCGSHVIADSVELLDKCPSCASDLPNLEEPELKTKKYPEVLLAVANSKEEAANAYRALASGEGETFAALCEGTMLISNQPLKFDVYRGTAAKEVADYVPQISIAANAEGNVQAHYFTTAADNSDEGQLHIVSSDASPIFCPQTSSGLVDPTENVAGHKATASDDEDEDEDDFDDEEDEEEDEDEDDEEEEEDDEDDEDEDDEEEDDDDLSLSLASEKSKKSKKSKGGVKRKVKTTASAKPAEKTEPVAKVETPEEIAAREQSTASAVQEPVEKVALTASFVAYASSEMKANTVDVAYAGVVAGEPTWVAFHNGVPFAKAVASAAAKPETFADESFGRAFKAIASESGVQHAMSELKFEEIRPVVDVEKLVQTEVETRVQAEAANLAEAANRDASELASRYEAALATAAQGVNRGFFRDLKNPMRVALASTLEDLGIQGGDELLARAFAEHSDDYNKMILAKASEIIKLDLTVQNQMAAAITDIQEQNVATAASLSVGRPVQTPAEKQRETATASSQSTDDFSAKLKGLRF